MNGISSIEINDEKIELMFGLCALSMMQERAKKFDILKTVGEYWTVPHFSYLIYSGYYNDCMRKNVAIKHDYAFFYDFVEEKRNDADVWKKLVDIYNVYNDSFKTDDDKPEEADDTEKKT